MESFLNIFHQGTVLHINCIHALKQTVNQTSEFVGSEEPVIPIGDFAMHAGTISQTDEFEAGEAGRHINVI